MNKEYFNGVGRRKNSTARVYLSDGKGKFSINNVSDDINTCLLYTSPSPRDRTRSRMPSSA